MKKPKVYRKGDVVGTIKDQHLLKAMKCQAELKQSQWEAVYEKLGIDAPVQQGRTFSINHETGVVTCSGELIYV